MACLPTLGGVRAHFACAGPTQPAAAPALSADPALVAQLASMGFSEAACTRAALAVKNAGPEAAMEWVLAHMEDPNINAPLGACQACVCAHACVRSWEGVRAHCRAWVGDIVCTCAVRVRAFHMLAVCGTDRACHH